MERVLVVIPFRILPPDEEYPRKYQWNPKCLSWASSKIFPGDWRFGIFSRMGLDGQELSGADNTAQRVSVYQADLAISRLTEGVNVLPVIETGLRLVRACFRLEVLPQKVRVIPLLAVSRFFTMGDVEGWIDRLG